MEKSRLDQQFDFFREIAMAVFKKTEYGEKEISEIFIIIRISDIFVFF